MADFHALLQNFEKNLEEITARKINVLKSKSNSKSIYDYKESKENYHIIQFTNSYSLLNNALNELIRNRNFDLINTPDLIKIIKNLEINFQTNNFEEIRKNLSLLRKFNFQKSEPFTFNSNKIPNSIKSEIDADIIELQKCFINECYRSCVILCGRLIETALHSKYYEETGFDILDKNPGIGLGNLIAKLKEKDIKLPPGITEQTHLINNVRTFSVHKKKEAFYPSKQQTLAIILFTLDVLEKLFV